MEMLVIAGFLGSGKTTLVLSVIDRIIERTGKKVVVIVNDFGTVGIDGKVMSKYGLNVKELASGCICCTLGADLLQTVQDIEATIAPDLIVIEPTGVADPSAIVSAMTMYEGNGLSRITSAVIVDASRFDVILKALGRPLTNQVKAADLILINKMDAVNAPEIERMIAQLREINNMKPIIPISATEGTNVDKVIDAMVMA
ncbi:MAG: GTP-binding protein [Methanomassiliicoccus sp.]|nr:GTP-binding protein [Methanomassiliicoccus sp.]